MANYPLTVPLSHVYVSISQAASLLLVSRLTIYRWMKQGKLSGERIGSVTLIPKQDILAIARQRGISL
jgi:excisionase family DNA binding protein